MRDLSLAHLTDAVLLRDLSALVAQDRLTTASLLAHVAEVDTRRLYVPAGFPSMHAYCVGELRLSDDASYKRIQAARAARRFPALYDAVAEGRLHLTAVCLIAPHLSEENAEELIGAATHRRKVEIEGWLARRFPLPAGCAMVREVVRAIPAEVPAPTHASGDPLVPAQVRVSDDPLVATQAHSETSQRVGANGSLLVPAQAGASDDLLVPAQVHASAEPPVPAHQSPERYVVQVTISKSTHDRLRYAQALLSHAVPGGDIAQVLDRALEALIAQLEKRRFGARAARKQPNSGSAAPQSAAPRPSGSRTASRHLRSRCSPARSRYLPAPIRRAVWERDQGQCTFVSANGNRCGARKFLEFDHVEPVARGGRTTVEGMRLRCRAHNQYEAERTFGAGFMSGKRDAARLIAAKRRGPSTPKR